MAQGFSVEFGKQEFEICPGDKFTGAIPLKNTSEAPVSLRIYLGDWVRIPGQGDYAPVEGVTNEPRSLIAWMTFTPDSMTLQPGEKRNITYEVNVPDDWTLEGSYWDLVFIEGIPTEEASAAPSASEQVAIGINTVFRYAIHVFATIQDTEIRAATFTTLNMEAMEGGFKATARFQNNGNTFIRPKVWVELHDAAGEVVFTQDHPEQTVLPESTRDFAFELKDLTIPSGEYLVLIMADYGAQNYVAAQGRVSLTISPPQESATSAGEGETGASGEGSPSG
jgi:hypothetical protein